MTHSTIGTWKILCYARNDKGVIYTEIDRGEVRVEDAFETDAPSNGSVAQLAQRDTPLDPDADYAAAVAAQDVQP